MLKYTTMLATQSWARATPEDTAAMRWLPLVAFFFAVLCTVLPILANSYLPLVDLPNHIARLHVATAPPDGPLAPYYHYSSAFVPNSAADLIWRTLSFQSDPVRFAQLLLAVYAVNLIAGAMVLSRVLHGRWSAWPAAAGLLVYSGPFFWGFQNFVWSLPFCLFGLTLWLAMEKQRWRRWRVATFVPLAATLYLMHFFAFAILAIAVFGREVQRLLASDGALLRRGLDLSIQMIPFVVPVLWLAITLVTGPEAPGPSKTEFGGPFVRIWAFMSPLTAPNTLGFPLLNTLAVAGMGLLALCLSRIFSTSGPQLVLHPQVKGPAIALAVAAVLAPSWLNGVALVHIRIPVLLVALLLAGTAWQGLSMRSAKFLAIAFMALIAARGVAFDRFAAAYGADIEDMLAATETLPAGARVLPLRAAGFQVDRRFYHIQGLLVARRDVFVPTLFQGVHALQVRDRWTDHAEPVQSSIDLRWVLGPGIATKMPRPVFTLDWERKFTHAVLFDAIAPGAVTDPRLVPLDSVGRFTLFRIMPDESGVPAPDAP